jgi:hypothetical protein
MTRLESIRVFFGRLGAYLWLKTGAYGYWSWLYRYLVEDKKKRAPLRRFDNIDELGTYVHSLKWRPDTWRQMWDSFSSPESVQWLADNEPRRLVGDCEDLAVFSANVVNRELLDNPEWSTLYGWAAVMTIMWMGPDGKFAGHNVCLLSTQDGWAYMDYGKPGPVFKSLADMAEAVRNRFCRGSIGVGYGVMQAKSLKTIIARWE